MYAGMIGVAGFGHDPSVSPGDFRITEVRLMLPEAVGLYVKLGGLGFKPWSGAIDAHNFRVQSCPIGAVSLGPRSYLADVDFGLSGRALPGEMQVAVHGVVVAWLNDRSQNGRSCSYLATVRRFLGHLPPRRKSGVTGWRRVLARRLSPDEVDAVVEKQLEFQAAR